MHPEAMHWLRAQLAPYRDQPVRVLEIGSRDINGSPRALLTQPADYLGVDLEAGPGVDWLADAAEMPTSGPFGSRHIVICAEVFEHTPKWREMCKVARELLVGDGLFVGTAAGEGRAPHSAGDGRLLAEWRGSDCDRIDAAMLADGVHVTTADCEWYENITAPALQDALERAGFDRWETVVWENHTPHDVYWVAR